MCLIPPHQQKVAGQEKLNNSLFGVPMHPFPQVPLLLHYSTIPYLRIQQRSLPQPSLCTLTQTLLQNYSIPSFGFLLDWYAEECICLHELTLSPILVPDINSTSMYGSIASIGGGLTLPSMMSVPHFL